MNVELRHLRVVCAIAEAGSLTKAAAALGLAVPSLTTQLRRIERTFGGQLFERDRHGARPTALGEFVLARARLLLPAVQGLRDEATRLAATDAAARRYRLGAINGPILGGIIHRLAETYPDAHITTYASWSADELAERALGGRLDFVLGGACGDAPPPVGHGLLWTTVATAPVFVLLPERHPLAGHDEVELAALAGAMWAATPGDGCLADCFAAACLRAGFTPRAMYETDVGGCIDLVQQGDAVVLAQPTFRTVPGLALVPLAGTPLRWRHLLGWHPESAAAAAAPRLVEYATAAYADAVARSPRYTGWLARTPA
jgi:DNA-binding transcriptional LysR family regulator